MTDLNAIWRAVVEAASAALPASEDRERLARQLADDAIARLTAEQSARPDTARDRLDAFTRAFTALDVNSASVIRVDMASRTDHIVTIGVHSYQELAALAAALDMPKLEHRIDGGYIWAQSAHRPVEGTAITIQAHKPPKHEAA